jgi:transcriptional antiterminator RfaH
MQTSCGWRPGLRCGLRRWSPAWSVAVWNARVVALSGTDRVDSCQPPNGTLACRLLGRYVYDLAQTNTVQRGAMRTRMSPSHWIVVNTQPNLETQAITNLTRQSFDVYCPNVLKRIRHARRTQEVRRPLFPGYVFVAYQIGNPWRAILSTYGVRSLIRQGDHPSLLDDRFVANLKAREVDGVVRKPETPFKLGQLVSLREGPLEGWVGQILEMRDNDRIILLLNLMNQATRVAVGPDMINAVPDATARLAGKS